MPYAAIASAAGSLAGSALGWDTASKNAEMQKTFAQKGIRWKVADAQAAGIHPLYALGAPTMSFNPVSTGDVAGGLAQAGQDVGRAIQATRTEPERIDAYTTSLRALQLQRGELENQLLQSQIAKLNASQSPALPTAGDPFLLSGQANSGLVETVPMKRQSVSPGLPHNEAGVIADQGFTRTPTGWAPLRSKDAMDRMDDDWAAGLGWNIRNRLLPMMGASMKPPFAAPSSHEWRFNGLLQEYQLVRKSVDRSRRHTREHFGNRF